MQALTIKNTWSKKYLWTLLNIVYVAYHKALGILKFALPFTMSLGNFCI